MNIKTRFEKIYESVGIIISVALILLVGIKSCTINPISFKEYVFLESFDEQGERSRVLLTTENEMLLTKKYGNIEEMGYYKIKGEEAIHYIFGIYCVGSFPLGLRYYNDAENVLDTELILLLKNGDSFPDIGESFNAKIVVYKDKAKIGKHTYKRIFLNKEEIEGMNNLLMQIRNSLK